MKCCRGDGGGHYLDLISWILHRLLSVLLILSFIVFYVFFWYLSMFPSCFLVLSLHTRLAVWSAGPAPSPVFLHLNLVPSLVQFVFKSLFQSSVPEWSWIKLPPLLPADFYFNLQHHIQWDPRSVAVLWKQSCRQNKILAFLHSCKPQIR